jgi:hypothetical protein
MDAVLKLPNLQTCASRQMDTAFLYPYNLDTLACASAPGFFGAADQGLSIARGRYVMPEQKPRSPCYMAVIISIKRRRTPRYLDRLK